jgi:hypothetical protein
MPREHLARNVVGIHDPLWVIDCQTCGHAHLDPLPDPEVAKKYYEEDKFWDGFAPPNWFLREAQEHKAGLWNAQYAWETQHLGSYSNLLDVGCGAGWFLAYWLYHGGVGYGVEPSPSARARSQVPCYIQPDDSGVPHLERLRLRLRLVLEHIVDPLAFMQYYLRERPLKVMIEVPNEFNPLQVKLEQRSGVAWYIQEPHINYWTPQSLNGLMARLGYVPTVKGATFPMELPALMGFNHVTEPNWGRHVHNFRLNFEKVLGTKAFDLYLLWHRKLGWGRELLYMYEPQAEVLSA